MEALNAGNPAREITESQRALELRKFFAPYLSHSQIYKDTAFNESLNGDGALSAYAETIVWRLGGVHCMVSLIDRAEQYFIAGATRSASTDGDELVEDSSTWFGCETVPTPGGLCENTLALDGTTDPYPCFIVNDLSQDDRFAALPVVDGSVASYRFYAGTPITTKQGINIGSFFVFDNKPRVGLTLKQKKYLHETGAKIMRHLEAKREAAERRRVVMMSQGISNFLESTADSMSIEPLVTEIESSNQMAMNSSGNTHVDINLTAPNSTSIPPTQSQKGNETVLDKIRLTLGHAAAVLRESLELFAGGVVFLDTAFNYTEMEDSDTYSAVSETLGGSLLMRDRSSPVSLAPLGDKFSARKQTIRSSDDHHKLTKVQAMSTAPIATWNHRSGGLDGKTLNMLINSYPKGNIWYIDDEGYFSSLEQISEMASSAAISPSGTRRLVSTVDITKQNAEATVLSQIFHKARQIMFLPLWDAGGGRWYSGCFVWSRSAVPVWTVESEIAYLSAFTNSVMVELSRLDAISSNKMKSDFISSISHEFRSPLHGILASAEFLRDSDLDASQVEFISTIQNCSGTLLDTINHVLDYSKINSFENAGSQHGNIPNELYHVTNIALLCEDLIDGMIAAGHFRGAGSAEASFPLSSDFARDPCGPSYSQSYSTVEIILDIEVNDWFYKVQAGALRRVVMNIFGNAQKYTDSGYILVEVKMRKAKPVDRSTTWLQDILLIHIRDTGRGMSSEYMERKLYHPFAQEDSFAPGVGLGLSIVWSIINQLGGKIQIRSELGKGTDVEITLPLERPDGSEAAARPDDLPKLSTDAQKAISALREHAAGKTVLVARDRLENVPSGYHDLSWSCIERYCSEWFGYHVITSREKFKTADLIITDLEGDWTQFDLHTGQKILEVHGHMNNSLRHKKGRLSVGSIRSPVGPFKLAHSIMSLFEQELPLGATTESDTVDCGIKSPLMSPENRLAGRLSRTDYGFTQALISPSATVKDEVAKQAIASLGALSLHMPPRYLRAATVPSVTLTPKEPTSNGVSPPTFPAHSSGALHILAVDDNALNLQLIHRYLLKRKIDSILTARNGLEAIAAVQDEASKSKSFDVIFMDISMPKMDGLEATRLIRSFERSLAHRSISEEAGCYFSTADDDDRGGKATETIPKTPPISGRKSRAYIVALTGLASRRDRDEAKLSGFDDFLTKPISFAKIGELLKGLSEKKERAQ